MHQPVNSESNRRTLLKVEILFFNELVSSQGRRCFVGLIMYMQKYKLPGTMICYI